MPPDNLITAMEQPARQRRDAKERIFAAAEKLFTEQGYAATSMRMIADVVTYTVREVPQWNPINICSYHLQEAGASPVQEVGFALANGISSYPAYGTGREHSGWLNITPQPRRPERPNLGQPGITVQFGILKDPALNLLDFSIAASRERIVAASALIDSTKMLCTDNRHRILHTFWAVQEIIIPVFGHTITNSAGQTIDVKDLCEKDHLLPDFQHRFIPTLGDFVAAMQDVPTQGLAQRLERFHADVIKDEAMSARMLSPLAATGQLKSLLITHNSWFINTILPMMRVSQPQWIDFDITPDAIFNPMRFELWMDNGSDVPPSARQLQRLKQVHF